MQKELTEKLINKLCTDTEEMYSLSPKVSPLKTTPNFISLLELLSLNTENEERINRILQSYYFSEYLKQIPAKLCDDIWQILFEGKSYSRNKREAICRLVLMKTGFHKKPLWAFELMKFIEKRQGYLSMKLPYEFKIKLCELLGLNYASYNPSKGEYRDYLIQRQNELVKLLEDDNSDDNKLVIKPDLKYQGMTRDLKEALFNKFSQFIEKVHNDAWEGKIDKNKLCSETQALTTDLKEYQKVASS